MDTNLFKKYIFILYFFIYIFPVFPQDFSRIIELQNPCMNGTDIIGLQKQLLTLGFSELGEADGYYGSLTEGIIKKIKTFSGFEINGTVSKNIWDYIFAVKNNEFLRKISTVIKYNSNELQDSGNIYNNDGLDFFISAYVYYSLDDKNIKIVKYDRRDYYTEISCTYYLINDNEYFVQQYFSDENSFKENDLNIMITIVNRILYVENGTQYEILNGNKILSRSNYYISIINIIENIVETFKEKFIK